MPKYVYLQIDGVEKAARILADSVVRQQQSQQQTGAAVCYQSKLIVKDGDTEVGEFNGAKVIGWWVQDE